MEKICIYSLPVSGRCFVSQIALVNQIKIFKPDIIFSSSGGNMAAYICAAGDFEENNVLRIMKKISSDIFVQPWFVYDFDIFTSLLIGFIKGSLYRLGVGIEYLFKKYFNEKSIKHYEIWTGTYNKTLNMAQFFCNRSSDESYVTEMDFLDSQEKFALLEPFYCGDENNSINIIASVCMASASIPYLIESVTINNFKYRDGGIMYSSPTLPLNDAIYRLGKNKKFRHFYFLPYDITCCDNAHKTKILTEELTQIFYTNLLIEKEFILNNLKRLKGSNVNCYTYSLMSSSKLNEILESLDHIQFYVCILFPVDMVNINILNFDYDDIIKIHNEVSSNYNIQIWY